MIRECPEPNPECPYYDLEPPKKLQGQEYGCYSDEDHIVPQRLAVDALSRAYIHAPINKQQLCRWRHDEKTLAGDEPLPPRDVMEARLITSGVYLSRKVRKALDQ